MVWSDEGGDEAAILQKGQIGLDDAGVIMEGGIFL